MSRADIQERARLLDEIDRLNALFDSRFHLDSSCGSCGGPLECDRDAICHRCTDAIEIKRLQAIVDRQSKAMSACKRELILYAGEHPDEWDDGTADAIAQVETAEEARDD